MGCVGNSWSESAALKLTTCCVGDSKWFVCDDCYMPPGALSANAKEESEEEEEEEEEEEGGGDDSGTYEHACCHYSNSY